ncbi:protein FAM135A-like [Rhipicephalus sanguineus]|uniref:protein FAM135A-like n=1 Tax=Rhipicephalus sanguineus TaxID=34632 RepID=UPI0020C40FCA|nr:protein FAM135A-like [Rhipicephalus sanguineus]
MILITIAIIESKKIKFNRQGRIMKHEVVVDFVVDLYTLYNFYLDAEGLYQVRASMQADPRYYSQVLLGPARRLNATYVSKSFFVTRTCDSIQNDLNETLRFEVHLFLKDDVRVRLVNAFYELRLEIWCSKSEKHDSPSRNQRPEPFVAVTARVLTLNFDPVRGLHDYYPLVFEVGNVSLLTMTVHASLVTICIPSGESMRNASVGHIVGQLCMCDGQSSCCYSSTIDKAVQQELNSLLVATASHLRKILEEHKRIAPISRKSKNKDVDIGNDPGSERARLRVSRYSTFDRPEAVRFSDEEAKKLSTILVVLWEQYVEAVAGHQELRFVLYEPLQKARIARLAEAYLILDKDMGAVYYDPVLGEDTYRRMVRKIRTSNYFKSFPVLEIECWPLDGNHKNTPIIFEERYRPFSAMTPITSEEGDSSGKLDEVAELASLHSLTAGSMELLALSSHPESEVCNCWRQFRATDFRLRRASSASLPPALAELYQGADSACSFRINDSQRQRLLYVGWN